MIIKFRSPLLTLLISVLLTLGFATQALGQVPASAPAPAPAANAAAPSAAAPNEAILGVVPVVDDGKDGVRPIKLAILPSLAPDLEDVIVRSVVRRDLELTGMFDVIDDAKAPTGMYGFDDPVDIDAWRNLGAEVIIKVAARLDNKERAKIFGLCYFLNDGKEPVYKKSILVPKSDVRVTAHRITDALLGAITGRNGGFASHLAFAARGARNHMVFTVDADGQNLNAVTDPDQTSIAPEWGPAGQLFHGSSVNYSPFFVLNHSTKARLGLPFKTSVYSVAFNRDKTRLAVAVAEGGQSAIYVGNADGSAMARVSNTPLATHPSFSPSGKLAWVGGGENGTQRVYLEGKPVSPAGFAAAAPTFCDTEDGVFLVYAVGTGGDHHDLVMSNERGGGMVRLTQNQGSNTYPACSPDGRLLAYFSVRSKDSGLFIKSLKSWREQKLSSRVGESLRWDALPAVAAPPPAAPAPAAPAPAAGVTPAPEVKP
jgi:TolB protein